MPRYLKLFISIVLCVSTLGLMGCNDYTPNPEDDIALFQPFIDANINKKSDDPYISSTVKPGDKLYDILVNIQHGRHDIAIKQLKPLVEKGDADAQFWYAKMIYQNSIKTVRPALELYKKSAEQGNLYAYFELSPEAEGCLAFFGEKVCTQENLTKTIEVFKQKAKQGDLRAQYFLLRMLKPDGSVIEHETYFSNNYNFTYSAETRQHYLKEVIRFAENHYYQPLMDYVDTILTFDRNKNEYVFPSKKLENLVVQLLTIGVNNNYLPATEQLIRLTKADIKPDSDLLKVNLFLGGKEAIVSQYALFNEQLSSSDRYYLGELYKKLSGSYFLSKVEPPTDLNEKAVLDNKVDQIIKNMTPMVYIDGFTSRDKWVD